VPRPKIYRSNAARQKAYRARTRARERHREPWQDHWKGMPEFVQENQKPFKTLLVHFASQADVDAFAELVKKKISTKKYIWYPKAVIGSYATKSYVGRGDPAYPVYIVSKGRWAQPMTARTLERMRVPYRIVIEPQEYDRYAAAVDPEKILVLPFGNLGQGSIPARNWIWEHAIAAGAERHWILDDNIREVYRMNRNLGVPVRTGAVFKAAEDFVNRYENVALAGFNYASQAHRKRKWPAFQVNTRIYSCILIKNDLPYRWRGRYNEDTDLSLRVLKDGWCTVLFNAFQVKKEATMSMRGGNTEELYQGDGRLKMAESLQAQHPDVVTVTRRWGRYQHLVDYSRFKANRLKLKPGPPTKAGVDNYGMVLQG
jgi:hypothetical protein